MEKNQDSMINKLKSKLTDLEKYIEINESMQVVSQENFQKLRRIYYEFINKQTFNALVRFCVLGIVGLISVYCANYVPSNLLFLTDITAICAATGILVNQIYKKRKIKREGKKLDKAHEQNNILRDDLSYAKELVQEINYSISMYEQIDKENELLSEYEEEVKKAYDILDVEIDCAYGLEEQYHSKLHKIIASRKRKNCTDNDQPKTLRIPTIYQ